MCRLDCSLTLLDVSLRRLDFAATRLNDMSHDLFTADVRQPWTNPHDLYFEYLIFRFAYLIIAFDYSIIE